MVHTSPDRVRVAVHGRGDLLIAMGGDLDRRPVVLPVRDGERLPPDLIEPHRREFIVHVLLRGTLLRGARGLLAEP